MQDAAGATTSLQSVLTQHCIQAAICTGSHLRGCPAHAPPHPRSSSSTSFNLGSKKWNNKSQQPAFSDCVRKTNHSHFILNTKLCAKDGGTVAHWLTSFIFRQFTFRASALTASTHLTEKNRTRAPGNWGKSRSHTGHSLGSLLCLASISFKFTCPAAYPPLKQVTGGWVVYA